jgi:hypothetical protein
MSAEMFWGEIAPCEHLLQIYEHDGVLIDSLTGFVSGGLQSGEGVVVIATEQHLNDLECRLERSGLDLSAYLGDDQYIPLNAERTLDQFMVNGWPNDELFTQVVTEILTRAKGDGRRVRAFGEMVALLWAKGHTAATVRLEHLWNTKLCASEDFSLFCAYPKIGVTQDSSESLTAICAAHSKVVGSFI